MRKIRWVIVILVLSVISIVIALVACQNNRRGGMGAWGRQNTFNQPIGQNTIQQSTNMNNCQRGNNVWGGGISCANGNNDQNFRDFLSSSADSEDLQSISCSPGNDSGAKFQLTVVTNSTVSLGGNNNNLRMIARSSELRILIVEDPHFSGDTQNLEFEVILQGKDGTINNNQANLTFENTEGSVTLRGTFNNNNFTGQMNFRNNRHYAGGRGSYGPLGNFRIPTCAVFNLGTNTF